jgi:hypothetical protein
VSLEVEQALQCLTDDRFVIDDQYVGSICHFCLGFCTGAIAGDGMTTWKSGGDLPGSPGWRADLLTASRLISIQIGSPGSTTGLKILP